MRSIVAGVRWAGLLAFLMPILAADAQIAIQVKNGTVWAATAELRLLQPLLFRWRWDGGETPTRVAWQLATQTPASTVTAQALDRPRDVIASETAIRLPAKAGVYEEFSVTPAESWPAKFYIRVRVDIARKAVYSRWIAVSVTTRATVAANPTCTIEGWKEHHEGGGNVEKPAAREQILPGSIIDGKYWNAQRILVMFRNRLSSTLVRYRREITLSIDGKASDLMGNWRAFEYQLMDPSWVQTTLAGKTDTLTFLFANINLLGAPVGMLNVEATTTPVSGTGSKCSLLFTVKP